MSKKKTSPQAHQPAVSPLTPPAMAPVDDATATPDRRAEAAPPSPPTPPSASIAPVSTETSTSSPSPGFAASASTSGPVSSPQEVPSGVPSMTSRVPEAPSASGAETVATGASAQLQPGGLCGFPPRGSSNSVVTVFWMAPLKGHQKGFLLLFALACFFFTLFETAYEGKTLLSQLWWFFSFSVAVAMPSFIQARRQTLEGILSSISQEKLLSRPNVPAPAGQATEHATPHQLFSRMTSDFVKHQENGWGPVFLATIIGCFFFFISFLTAPDFSAAAVSRAFWLKAVTYGFGFGFFGRAFWLILCFGALVNDMSREYERTSADSFSFEILEHAGMGYGRTAIGAALLSACLLWMFLSNLWLFNSARVSLAAQVVFIDSIFLLAVLFPFFYLIVPQFRFHRMLVKRKEEIKNLFFSQFLQTERTFIASPTRELAQKYLLERQIMQEIENLPEWPFRLETLFPVLSVVALPVALFFFKEIAVGVIVELLKK